MPKGCIFYWEQCFSENKISDSPVVIAVIEVLLFIYLYKVIFCCKSYNSIRFVQFHKQWSISKKVSNLKYIFCYL